MPYHCGLFCPYRRKLRADIAAAFPSLSVEELNELIPNKEELNNVKIYAHKGDAVTVYVLHKNPIFFQLEKQVFPTGESAGHHQSLLRMLMKCLLILACCSQCTRCGDVPPWYQHSPRGRQFCRSYLVEQVSTCFLVCICVSQRTHLTNFSPADLMLPGVVVSASGLPELDQGDCCAVTLVTNR